MRLLNRGPPGLGQPRSALPSTHPEARSPSLCPVLWVLIPVLWLAVVSFGLIICRLGARSDRSHALEIAEWLAAHEVAEREVGPRDSTAEQSPFKVYRATG